MRNHFCTHNSVNSGASDFRFDVVTAYWCAVKIGRRKGATEIAGLDIVGPVWQGWTMTDDIRTGVIWLVIDVVDQ